MVDTGEIDDRTRRDRFAHEVLAALRPHVAEVWYDSDEFRLGYRHEPGDGEPNGWVHLSVVYRECADADPDERERRVANLVRAFTADKDMPESWSEVRDLLRPVLRPATFGIGGGPAADAMLSRPALPFLREFVVVDRPTSMAYVGAGQLETWGVTGEEVFAVARANLTGAATAVWPDSPSQTPAVWRFVESGDDYVTSWLLVDGWLRGLADRAGTRPFAFVPDQHTLLVALVEPEQLGPLFEMVEEHYREAVRDVSPVAYTVDDAGAVVPYAPPVGHPVEIAARRARVLLAGTQYAGQRDRLAEAHQDDDDEYLHVAALMAFERPDGTIRTSTTWTEGVEALLPRADEVVLLSMTQDGPFAVPWETVVREVGLVPVDGLDPARYRVTGWPPEPVLRRLLAQAVDG